MENEQKDIIEKLDNIDKTVNELNIDFHDSLSYIFEKIDIENYGNESKKISQTDVILSVIFGFLVGYFLVKSFFDGYKI